MQNKSYLPSDIHSNALRTTYYAVQKVLSDRYEKMLSRAPSKDASRKLKEQFNTELRETIRYYVELAQ